MRYTPSDEAREKWQGNFPYHQKIFEFYLVDVCIPSEIIQAFNINGHGLYTFHSHIFHNNFTNWLAATSSVIRVSPRMQLQSDSFWKELNIIGNCSLISEWQTFKFVPKLSHILVFVTFHSRTHIKKRELKSARFFRCENSQ